MHGRFTLSVFLFALLLLAPAPRAQNLPAAAGVPQAPASLEDRRKALASVVHSYWEDVLKHNPELASSLGDTRFNDRLTNYTAAAFNDAIAREQGYLMQLAVIDAEGFTSAETQQQDALEQRLEEEEKFADNKPWETPIHADGGFYAVYPQLAQTLTFATAKDYDDWTARLQALPEAFAQAMQDMSLGIDEGRVPPKDVLDKALGEVSTLAHQKPEESPLAAPLKKFPATVTAAEQERIKQEMLAAVGNDALAAYLRLERFLRVSYVPAAGKGPAPQGTHDAQLLAAVLHLRAQAEQAQSAKFDLKAFRDAVEKAGPLPVDQIQKQLDDWIANGGK